MAISLNRRTFIGAVAAASTTGAINPLGLLQPGNAYGSVPTGDYLRHRDPSRFWFRRLKSDVSSVANTDTLKPVESPEGQLSLRIGGAGGFAIGFFSTLNFLSKYKSSRPDDYIDLITNAARIPSSLSRVPNILRLLEIHRRTAGTALDAPKSALRDGTVTPFNQKVLTTGGAETGAEVENEDERLLRLTSPLEGVTRKSIQHAFHRVDSESRAIWSFNTQSLVNDMEPQTWDDAQKVVQSELTSEFHAFSDSWDDRFPAMDVSRLMKYEEGKLKLEWVDDVLLALEFQSGVERGRLAALANSAFSDVASLTGEEEGLIPSGEGPAEHDHLERVSKKLAKMRLADDVSKCFGDDQFWRYAFDSAPFRPAIRLKLICAVNTVDVGTRLIEMTTPFLPYDATRALGEPDKVSDKASNHEIASYVSDSFGDPSVSRWSLPLVTAALPQASFQPCREMIRHTIRLLETVNQKQSEIFKSTSLESIVAVPEVTSPWTFAGVSAAFCNTYLMALDENKLNTEEARAGYRRNVGMSVDMLLKQSVGRGSLGAKSKPELVANSSAITPAMVQYASGYRAATVFSDRVTDQIAQAEGARKVYRNLQVAMPEYFKDLADDKFLTAEVIAGHVLLVATSVQSEIDRLREEVVRLRLRVEQLEATVAQYQKFVTDFKLMLDSIQTQLTGVHTQDDLRRFQESNQDLVNRLASAFDDAQRSMVGSLQGLVNTFVVISNEITVNVSAEVRAQVEAEFEARVAEKAKVQVNLCSIGNQK